jgi:hypothetical protein
MRLYDSFSAHVDLAEVLAVVDGCRRDLDIPDAQALPELVERLARERIAQRVNPDPD